MAENIGPIEPGSESAEKLVVNGRELDVYYDIKLPDDDARHAICVEDLGQGAAAEVFNDFILFGAKFPSKDEDPIFRYRYECAGWTACNGCGLHVTQYDRSGNKIT